MRGTGASVLVVVAALTGGCASGGGAGGQAGPLTSNLVSSEVCLPVSIAPALTGAGLLVSSEAGVTLTGAELVDPDGISLTASYVLADSGTSAIGVVSSPPGREDLFSDDLERAWQQRRPAAGAALLPGVKVQLVLAVDATKAEGKAAAVQVAYSYQGRDYVLVLPRRTQITSGTC